MWTHKKCNENRCSTVHGRVRVAQAFCGREQGQKGCARHVEGFANGDFGIEAQVIRDRISFLARQSVDNIKSVRQQPVHLVHELYAV